MLNTQWQTIQSYKVGGEQAALFIEKLQKHTGWSEDFCDVAINEYKRFIYLASTSDRPISPSRVVDEIWHLHLTFSRCYWENLCEKVLCKALHHEPFPEQVESRENARKQYADTLAIYRNTFGENAPQSIWPQPKPVRAMLPKNTKGYAMTALAGLLSLSTAAWGANGQGFSGALLSWSLAILIPIVIFLFVRRSLGTEKNERSESVSDSGHSGHNSIVECSSTRESSSCSSSNDSGGGGSSCGASCGS